MYKKILVAYDGSVVSTKALDHAAKLAKAVGAEKVTILHAINTTVMINPMVGPQIFNTIDVDDTEILDAAIAYMKDEDVPHDVLSQLGDPALAITGYAKDHGYDLIVVGATGKGMVKRAFLGSVSTQVLHSSECPVLVVK